MSSETKVEAPVCEDCAPVPPEDAAFASVETAGLQDPRIEPAIYDPLNPATFVAPKTLSSPSVVIEFCDRVSSAPLRWTEY